MNMQELLTYVEELTFKTSMFGYDKDEVDIQLDKICDEAEAIILAKEKEIEELKKESKTALGIAAAATGKTMEELEKDTQEDIVETEEQPEEAKNPRRRYTYPGGRFRDSYNGISNIHSSRSQCR